MDRLNNMITFVRIVDSGSLSAAARALQLSLPAVSRQLSAVEARLGVQLVRRTTRHLAVTEAGSAYYQSCRRILAAIDEAEDETASLHGELRGTLVVNGPGAFGRMHLAPMVPEFLALYPRLQLDLRFDDRTVDLFEESTDLLVRIGRIPNSTSLVARPLAEHQRVICASPGYLARAGRPTPEELMRHACILLTRLPTPAQWTLRSRSQTVRVHVGGRLSLNSGDAMREAALSDGGVILAPTWLVAGDLRQGTLELLLPAWKGPSAPVYALYARHRSASAKVGALVAFLRRKWSRRTDWHL